VLINELMEAVAQLQREKCAEKAVINCDELTAEDLNKKLCDEGFSKHFKKEIYANYQVIHHLDKPSKYGTIAFAYGINKDSILNAKIWT
jgi:hypothetical protein